MLLRVAIVNAIPEIVSLYVFVFPSPSALYVSLPECWPELYVTHLVAVSLLGRCVAEIFVTQTYTDGYY